MVSTFSDISGEIDEVRKSIIKQELIIDAVRNVVSKGGLTSEEEEHVLLTLNPSEIGKREIDALGLSDEKQMISRVQRRNIPALRGLVEKELNETFNLMQKLENATNFINKCDLDIPSKVTELQMTADATSENVHKLYKRLKILLGLYTTDRTSCLMKKLEMLTLKASEVAGGTSESEDAILQNIFHDASEELLADIVKELETELAAVTEECDVKEKQLQKYEAQKAQLLPLADTLQRLNEEIALRKMALQALSD